MEDLIEHADSIDEQKVLYCIALNTNNDRLTVKWELLDYLRLEDNGHNRYILSKCIKALKERGDIYMSFGMDDDYHLWGRGYAMAYSKATEIINEQKLDSNTDIQE